MFLILDRFSEITSGVKQLYSNCIDVLVINLNNSHTSKSKRDTRHHKSHDQAQRRRQKELDQIRHDYDGIKMQTDQLHFQLDQIEADKQTILAILKKTKIASRSERDVTGAGLGVLDLVFKGIGQGFGNIFGLATTSLLGPP